MATCYPLAAIQALAKERRIIFANRRAERNALGYGWTLDTLSAFVCGLAAKHHKGVRRELSVFDGRQTLDADKYVARFNEESGVVTTDSRHCAFFAELGIRALPNGEAVLVISFHLDGQP